MKKIFLLIVTVLFIGVVLSIITGYPLVINLAKQKTDGSKNLVKGAVINPMNKFNFDSGEWVAYLFISSSDRDGLPDALPKARSLKTNDLTLLKDIRDNWNFIYSGGDMATVESQFILCRNGVEMFESGIVLDGNPQGLQNAEYGWLAASPKTNLTKYIVKFKRNYSPLVIIR